MRKKLLPYQKIAKKIGVAGLLKTVIATVFLLLPFSWISPDTREPWFSLKLQTRMNKRIRLQEPMPL